MRGAVGLETGGRALSDIPPAIVIGPILDMTATEGFCDSRNEKRREIKRRRYALLDGRESKSIAFAKSYKEQKQELNNICIYYH